MNERNDEWEEAVKVLIRALENIAQSMCDDYVKKNAEFRSNAGLKPKIIRRMRGETCEWCRQLAGTYPYGEEPREVYQRHDNCDCTVEYVTEKGSQDVHTKQWTSDATPDKIEARKSLQASTDVFQIADYQSVTALNGSAAAKADWATAKKGGRHSGIYQDALKKSKKQLQKSIISHTEQVKLHSDKIAHPEQYDVGWADKSEQQRKGLLKKWQKDKERNAQQANVEIYAWKERFGNGNE